jgi:hypothetical protein
MTQPSYPHDPPGQPGGGWGGSVAVLDLDTLPVILPPLPPVLRGATIAVPLTRQTVFCPYCDGPVAGLLAGCDKPDCRRAELDADLAIERNQP